MKGRIEPDDLRPGQYVIVSEWYDETVNKRDDEDDYFWYPRPEKPKKPVGVPFKILAVALPFATVEALSVADRKRGVLDTRTAALIEVDLAYVRSLLPAFKPSGARKTSSLSKEERIKVQRYFMKDGEWRDILEEPKR